MDTALVVGGTRFIGRHAVSELLDHGYDVTILNRGRHENPFEGNDRVAHVECDRTDEAALEAAASAVEPDLVIDCVAYHPDEVRVATEVFADAEAYVYVSSGAVYEDEIPKREGETPLRPCSAEQAVDDSHATYGARKAEGDREVFAAAERGANAKSVRPTVVYGPYDYSERLDYWIDRVANHAAVVVPGDGLNLWHRVYVEDVASALRIVAERGEPGGAYNVGDRRLVTLSESVELIARALETDVEIVPATERELSVAGLAVEAFPLYRAYPHVLDTSRLHGLGWASTPLEEALARSVEDHLESGRDGRDEGPDRAEEERVLEVLETV